MSSVIFLLVRWYLKLLAKIAPRKAGDQAFRLFSTPRFRRPIAEAAEPLMAQAESWTMKVECGLGDDVAQEDVVAFRWRPEGGEDLPSVLLIHGWESRAARLTPWVGPLLAEGFQVVSFDAPAHGLSSGKRANPLVFAQVIRQLADHVGSVDGVVGHSLGTLAGILALAGGDLLGQENVEARALVAVAGAESGPEAMAYFCRVLGLGETFLPLMLASAARAAGRPMAEFDGHRVFARCSVPTLWLHDPEDAEVPLSGAEAVAAACPHVTLQTVHGLGHHRIARDPAIIARGAEFLVSQLRPASSP